MRRPYDSQYKNYLVASPLRQGEDWGEAKKAPRMQNIRRHLLSVSQVLTLLWHLVTGTANFKAIVRFRDAESYLPCLSIVWFTAIKTWGKY